MASAISCLHRLKQTSFLEIIELVISEGGDADTNAAVGGALMGCYIGFKKLPKEWIESFEHREWLEKKVEAFIKSVFGE
jgi:ADP-ribosylglycohydrolase